MAAEVTAEDLWRLVAKLPPDEMRWLADKALKVAGTLAYPATSRRSSTPAYSSRTDTSAGAPVRRRTSPGPSSR